MASLIITDNHLLALGPILSEHKEFHIKCGSHILSSNDREILIFHKREIKAKNFKDLGSNMTVFVLKSLNHTLHKDVDHHAFSQALNIFTSFDENTGTKKGFLPHYKQDKATLLTANLQTLHHSHIIEKFSLDENNYIQTPAEQVGYENTIIEPQIVLHKELSYLFGLALIWGHWNVAEHNNQKTLNALKINIPTFGQFTHHEETLMHMSQVLTMHNIFVDIYKTSTDSIECVISDYDVLSQFAVRYNPIASFDKISKKDLAETLKEKIFAYMQSNNFTREDIELLQSSAIKPLTIS